MYIESVLHTDLGYPKPRSTNPGEQGVIICDGIGTHLGYHVGKKAINMGMEIMLRVPDLCFVLEGEDTINFKVLVMVMMMVVLVLRLFKVLLMLLMVLLPMLLLLLLLLLQGPMVLLLLLMLFLVSMLLVLMPMLMMIARPLML
jgi:hypothetical protein